jgi:hypothetical protein
MKLSGKNKSKYFVSLNNMPVRKMFCPDVEISPNPVTLLVPQPFNRRRGGKYAA